MPPCLQPDAVSQQQHCHVLYDTAEVSLAALDLSCASRARSRAKDSATSASQQSSSDHVLCVLQRPWTTANGSSGSGSACTAACSIHMLQWAGLVMGHADGALQLADWRDNGTHVIATSQARPEGQVQHVKVVQKCTQEVPHTLVASVHQSDAVLLWQVPCHAAV